jgi:hypothetical protein
MPFEAGFVPPLAATWRLLAGCAPRVDPFLFGEREVDLRAFAFLLAFFATHTLLC